MTAPVMVWAWPNDGRRWHLRARDADLALCGAGKRGWELIGDAFDHDEYIFVCSCRTCIRIERTEHAGRDGGE
jgi:hypothetical protein